MTEEELQAWRRTRLEALANQLGGKAALGRKLGYEDGAFVGQMIKGLRPISEKTVRAAEALEDRFRGWFSFLPPEQMPSAAERYSQLLRDLDDIPPGRRHRFLDEIQEAAEQAREAAAYHASRAAPGSSNSNSQRENEERPPTPEEIREAQELEFDPSKKSAGPAVGTPPTDFPHRPKRV